MMGEESLEKLLVGVDDVSWLWSKVLSVWEQGKGMVVAEESFEDSD